jgi:hypothetical protein
MRRLSARDLWLGLDQDRRLRLVAGCHSPGAEGSHTAASTSRQLPRQRDVFVW